MLVHDRPIRQFVTEVVRPTAMAIGNDSNDNPAFFAAGQIYVQLTDN
jgi:hypothetical protein